MTGSNWREVEYPGLVWGIKNSGFDGFTMTEGYQNSNDIPREAVNIGLWDSKIVSAPKIIKVSDFLNKHPEYGRSSPAKVSKSASSTTGVSSLKINVTYNLAIKLDPKEVSFKANSFIILSLENYPSIYRKVEKKSLIKKLEAVANINPMTSKSLTDYLNSLYLWLISCGGNGDQSIEFSIKWFKILQLIKA
jgi:hypothetical protein